MLGGFDARLDALALMLLSLTTRILLLASSEDTNRFEYAARPDARSLL
jgi:hypothetical protein